MDDGESTTTDILRLCSTLHDDNSKELLTKINKYLEDSTHAEIAFVAYVEHQEEIVVVKVVGDRELSPESRSLISDHILNRAIYNQDTLLLDDLDSDKFSQITSLMNNVPMTSFLCVPILSPVNVTTVLLVCLVNKTTATQFEDNDINVLRQCFQFTQGILLNTFAYEDEKRLRFECQSLLAVAKNLFSHLDNVTILLKEIMTEARNLTKAERCSLFLVEKEELVSKVFDGEDIEELRIPISQGIVGQVASTGQILNIRDAYAHPLFYKEMDQNTGFKTRNILCFPIKDNETVIGVAELCNKISGLYFTTFDEEIAMAFSVYCGLSIIHSLMYKNVRDAQYRSKLSNELMMYHMKISPDDYIDLITKSIPAPEEVDPNFIKFHFIPRQIPEDDTTIAVFAMMEDIGMIKRIQIRQDTLARFVCMVRRGYRDPPYHNWMHAFSVAHFSYLLLKNLNLCGNEILTELEGFTVFLACLCHDLDHRGTTNSFQLASNSALAGLYSSEGSVMERHHFAQAMCILNTDGCNILENLSEKEYTKCLDLLRDLILATDLAHHIGIIGQLTTLASEGYDKENEEHHLLLLCLMMTSSDLSDQTKEWRWSKKIADLVYKEFFSQGDLEKAMGNKPHEMMDRERAFIPALQLQFLDDIGVPVYDILAKLFPGADETIEAVRRNRIMWQRAQDVILTRKIDMATSLDILHDEVIEKEVLEGN